MDFLIKDLIKPNYYPTINNLKFHDNLISYHKSFIDNQLKNLSDKNIIDWIKDSKNFLFFY